MACMAGCPDVHALIAAAFRGPLALQTLAALACRQHLAPPFSVATRPFRARLRAQRAERTRGTRGAKFQPAAASRGDARRVFL
jgi:hypothetical protein